MIAAFKFYMSRTAERSFRYFAPSPSEEAEFSSRQEKRTHHKEMETRFLHPALQKSQIFTVMVHKSQEALAREVLSEYSWFRDSDVEIKAIREVSSLIQPITLLSHRKTWSLIRKPRMLRKHAVSLRQTCWVHPASRRRPSTPLTPWSRQRHSQSPDICQRSARLTIS